MATLPELRPSGSHSVSSTGWSSNPIAVAFFADENDTSSPTALVGTDHSATMELTDTPTDFLSMDSFTIRIRAALSGDTGDDTYAIRAYLVDTSGAAISSVPAFTTLPRSTTVAEYTFTPSLTASNTKATWDAARLFYEVDVGAVMSADNFNVRTARIGITGTYTPSKSPPNTPVITNPADNTSASGTVSLQATVSDPDGEQVRAEWELRGDTAAPYGANIFTLNTPGIGARGVTWAGSDLWVSDVGSDLISRIDPLTGATLQSFTHSTGAPAGIAWDGTNLLVTEYVNDVLQTWSTDGTLLNSKNLSFQTPEDVAWDGTNVWVISSSENLIYKLDASGAVILSFTAPGATGTTAGGLTWDGTYLYSSDTSTDLIYRINPTDGTMINSFTSPSGVVRGLGWDGQNLWAAADVAEDLHKLSNGTDILVDQLIETITPNATTVTSGTTHTTSWTPSIHPDGEYKIRAWAFNTTGIKSTTYDEHSITLGVTANTQTLDHQVTALVLTPSQHIRPDSIVLRNSWTGDAGETTNLHLKVNEVAPGNDADFLIGNV